MVHQLVVKHQDYIRGGGYHNDAFLSFIAIRYDKDYFGVAARGLRA